MWLHIPKESYPSTQVEEDSTLDLEWLFPMLEQSVMWREKSRQSQYWSKQSKTNTWMMRLFGQIPQPLIAQRGLEKWIGSLEDSHANHGQLQEKEKESKTKDGSGMTSANSFAHYDQKESSWKTYQASLLDMELTPYSDRFPKWGMMQNGEVSKLPMSELPTGENVYSYWRTSQASDGEGGTKEMREGVNSRYKLRDHSANVVANWMTPMANDQKYRFNGNTQSSNNLEIQSRKKSTLQHSHQDQTQKNGNQYSEITQDSPQPWKNLRLNPMFVEWLMGWPLDYTGLIDSEYLETESYLSRQRMHLLFLLEDSKLKF